MSAAAGDCCDTTKCWGQVDKVNRTRAMVRGGTLESEYFATDGAPPP